MVLLSIQDPPRLGPGQLGHVKTREDALARALPGEGPRARCRLEALDKDAVGCSRCEGQSHLPRVFIPRAEGMGNVRARTAMALVFGISLATRLRTGFLSASPGPRRPASEVWIPDAPKLSSTTDMPPRSPHTASWAAAFALAGAACAGPRELRRLSMQSKHDKKTFRGKLHAHSFGKYRLRKNKARRIQAMKNGTFDPDTTMQQGQPEPEHSWDYDNLIENPIYYAPDYLKDAMKDYWDDVNEAMRQKWKDYMGIKGSQRYFKNWTPPGVSPQP